jgi:HEAT repeat protein
VRVCEVLARRAGATAEVIGGLCRALRADDGTWVQVHAALALARLGPAAAAAGPDLLRAARTGEAAVREEAMRALAMIQPAEAAEAFTVGLKDAAPAVRLLASAGWMKATAIPDDAIAGLVDALHDPEVQVRANAAHALGRLDALPDGAVGPLTECAADPFDGLRLNAAVALRLAPPEEAGPVLAELLADPSVKVRLVAARGLLAAEPAHPGAAAVVREALGDPSPRVRAAAEELAQSLPEEVTVATAEDGAEGGPAAGKLAATA